MVTTRIPKSKTYMEMVIEEAIRPMVGAIELLQQEIESTLQIPDAPWKILNKPYDQLTEQELLALMDIYHDPQEQQPCPFCQWVSREELMKMRRNKKEFGG